MIETHAGAGLALAGVPALVASAYLLALVLFSARRAAPGHAPPHLRFDIVIPAHDEEAGVASTVASLLSVDYPAALRRVIVVADNCADSTAARARDAGASVLVRDDPEHRGKGFALSFAFEQSLADGFADAVVVVDADSSASANFLLACASRLDAGALAVQAHYGVRNPDASWRTRLMAVALALFHSVRSLGRERLGCSVGLRGNGMCFSTRVLREVPHDAFSIVEDIEYGIRLGLAGHRVHYAAEAAVAGDMAAGADAARVQRRRWERGRFQIARAHAFPLLRRGLLARDRVLIDLALDLLVPPFAYLAAAAASGTAVTALASVLAGRALWALWVWGASLAGLGIYLARGLSLSGMGLRALVALLHAPAYLAWKLGLALGRGRRRRDSWVRTPRERGS